MKVLEYIVHFVLIKKNETKQSIMRCILYQFQPTEDRSQYKSRHNDNKDNNER